MSFKRLNIITGWLVFLVAAWTYIATIEPTSSFWDCGEFIATAYKLEVGHPPGAPLFMILARVASAFVSPENVPVAVNVLSALASAFTILFLFWSITHMAYKMATREGALLDLGATIAVLGSGVVGALAYTWSDSFWFSAVEGEVYALSSFFTAVVFWAILKWESQADEAHSTRWLILIAYLMGLSIGVHLLNLLCIPAIAFVYYFKRYQPSLKGDTDDLRGIGGDPGRHSGSDHPGYREGGRQVRAALRELHGTTVQQRQPGSMQRCSSASSFGGSVGPSAMNRPFGTR
jgi:hypothetical protein